MKFQNIPLLLVLGLAPFVSSSAQADEVSDKKAEIQRKRDEARKKVADDKKAAAEKAAADKKAAAEKAAADAKKEAEKNAASGGSGGTSSSTAVGGTSGRGGTGGVGGSIGAGGTGGTSATGGTGGKSGAGGKAAVEEKDPPLPAIDIESLRKDRGDRRKASVERLRRRWGGTLLADLKGVADLKAHARRVAFLQRIRLVADAKKDKKTIEAVDELLTREDDRHSKAMNALREGALTVGAAK